MLHTEQANTEIRILISALIEKGKFEPYSSAQIFEMVTGQRKDDSQLSISKDDSEYFYALIDRYNFLLIEGTPSGNVIDAIFEDSSLIERYMYAPAMESQAMFDFSPIED